MRFEILIGPEDGRIVECQGKRVAIGRSASGNDFEIRGDKRVSGFHAEAIQEGPTYKILDRRSKNGTEVKDKFYLWKERKERLEAPLVPGDVLIMGKLWVRFLG